MEESGVGIDDLLSNSTELFAVTGLRRSDLQGDEQSDGSEDEIEQYMNANTMYDQDYLESDGQESDPDEELHQPPRHTSTPVKQNDKNDPSTSTSDLSELDISSAEEVTSEWTNNITPLAKQQIKLKEHGLKTTANTALEAFYKVFDFNMFDTMVAETNLYASQKQRNKPDPNWTPTTISEMKAFIGIHIVMGLVNYPRYHLYWSEDDFFTNAEIKKVPGY